MKKLNLPTFVICILAFASSFAYAERNFPTDEEVTIIVKTCAGGYSKSVQGDVEASIKLWRKQGEISGQANMSELGGIISALKSDDAKVAVFEIYSNCIKSTLPQYMGNESKNNLPPQPAIQIKKTHANPETEKTKISAPAHYKVLRYRVTKVYSQSPGIQWELVPPLSPTLDTLQVLFWSNGMIKISGNSGAPTGQLRTFNIPKTLEGLVFELQIDHIGSDTIIKVVFPGQETLYPGAELRVQGIRSISEENSQWQLEVESI